MLFAIHGRNFNEAAKPFIQAMFQELQMQGFECVISEPYAAFLAEIGLSHHISNTYNPENGFIKSDFMLSVGGDGTLLDAVTHVGKFETPILGINTGRLGFLATTSPDKIKENILELMNGNYEIEKRKLVEVKTSKNIFGNINFGLNEFGIMKTDRSSMIVIKAYLDGELLNSYWADGLIISTPTGSTGYCMSVGGPLVMPTSDIFIIAPMSPHNLNVRPLVVSSNSKLSFEIESRSDNCLISLDSRSQVVDSSIKIKLSQASFKAHLVKMSDVNFLSTLRNKLSWGLDVRN